MKKVMKFFSYLVLMLALLIFFLPKLNLYYAVEAILEKKKVYISDEEVLDRGFSLELRQAKLFFDKLPLAEIERIQLLPLVFYTTFDLTNIRINEGFSDFLPQEIHSVHVEHLFYNPMKVKFKGTNEDSHFYGNIDLLERVLSVHLRLSAKSEQRYATMLRKLSKEEGGYFYEYKF